MSGAPAALPPRARIRAFAAAAVAICGCASPIGVVDGVYRDPRLGFQIASPRAEGAAWRRVPLDGTLLSFRRDGLETQTLTLQARCGQPVADPAIMARHLLIGTRGYDLRQAGPVEVAGRQSWSQTFEVEERGARVRVKSVTLVEGDCTFDFLLAAGEGFAEAEPTFDAWCESFAFGEERGEEPR